MSLQLDERRIAILAELGIHHVPITRSAPTPVERGASAAVAVAVAVAAPVAGAHPVARPPVDALQWEELAQAVAQCRACRLSEGRKQPVFGSGNMQADWLIVAEPPDEQEDMQGEPFVGPAGKLLDNMLRAMGLDRTGNVYIANVLKCRPPGNRNPEPEEVAQCETFLRRQVQLLQPKIILAMGRFAVKSLLGSDEPPGKLRGQRHQYLGVPVVVTYHPANLLRNPAEKAKAWADLCLAMELVRSQPA